MNSKVTKSVIQHHPRSLADVDWFLHGKRRKSNWIVCSRIGVKTMNIWNRHTVTWVTIAWTIVNHLNLPSKRSICSQNVCPVLYLVLKAPKSRPKKGAVLPTLGFWEFWGSFAPHLVRKYIIPGPKSLPQYHRVASVSANTSFVSWAQTSYGIPKKQQKRLKFRIIDGFKKIVSLHINGCGLSGWSFQTRHTNLIDKLENW